MNFRKRWVALIVVLVVLVLVFFVRNNQEGYPNKSSAEIKPNQVQSLENSLLESEEQTTVVVNEEEKTSGISKEVLAQHSELTDCWISYDGKVYDVTSFLPKHPGSASAISPYCGTSDEFKQAFEKKHGTSKVSYLMKVGTFIGDFDVMGSLN